MSEDRTRALIDAFTRGEQPALDDLIARHVPRLHAYVRLRMGPGLRAREGTMDIVQSVCREALGDVRRGFDYRGEAAFVAWLLQAALNKLRDRHRFHAAAKRDVARESPGAALAGGETDPTAYASLLSPSRDAIGREQIERLEAAFDELPEAYREVIILARGIGLPHAEVAAQMNRSPGATRMLLGRALAQLGDLIADDD